jgi:hypothetical protein
MYSDCKSGHSYSWGEINMKTVCKVFLCVIVAISLCVIAQPASWSQDITSGLEGHWTFDDSNGITVADSSGNGRVANARAGEPTVVPGVKGSALQFTGADSLEVTDWFGIEGANPRTVTCWIKSTDLNTHGIVSWGDSNNDGTKYHIRINNSASNGIEGSLRTEIQGTFNVSTTPINDDQWHFIASVFPDDGLYMVDVLMYVDGELEERSGTNDNGTVLEVNTSASADLSDQFVRIGSRQQGENENFFTGLIDEVRIYSRALSQNELQDIMAQESSETSGFTGFMLYK